MFNKTLGAAAVAAIATFGASAATAATVTVDRQSSNALIDAAGDKFGFASDIMVGADTYRVGVGALQLTSDDGSIVENFMAFCLQPLERLSLPRVYEMGVDATQDYASKMGDLNTLAANFMGDVVDSVSGMAFQLAVWEIVAETDAVLDVSVGNFKNTMTLGARSTAMDLANTWLGQLGTLSTADSFLVLNADNTQDLLTSMDPPGAPVGAAPLPASALLMLTVLGGAVMAGRRKA